MLCPKCQLEMIDQRAAKTNPKQPDYTCQDVNCLNEKGYRTGVWLKKAPAPQSLTQRPAALAQPEPKMPWEPDTRDAAICSLFWNSFDMVLNGLRERKLTDMFNGEQIAALTATAFIQRSKR